MRWAGRIARMENIANAYKISVGKPSAMRPTRIIILRECNIEKSITETGGEYTEWINLFADRVQWLTREQSNTNPGSVKC